MQQNSHPENLPPGRVRLAGRAIQCDTGLELTMILPEDQPPNVCGGAKDVHPHFVGSYVTSGLRRPRCRMLRLHEVGDELAEGPVWIAEPMQCHRHCLLQ